MLMYVIILLKINQIKMKNIFFIVALFASAFVQKSFAQDNKQLSQLLNSYYDIKNALVAGNAASASVKAGDFIKAANTVDYKIMHYLKMQHLFQKAKISRSSVCILQTFQEICTQ